MTMLTGRTQAVLLAATVLVLGGGTGLVAVQVPAPAQVPEEPPAKLPPAALPQPPTSEPDKPGTYGTPNFVVEAPNYRVARLIGQAAERARKEQALAWLGKELPQWPEPCPIHVTIQMSGTGAATTFNFDAGKVRDQRMRLEGPLERLLTSALPHEVTHTVLAHEFGRPLPRWADEGAAVLAEDEEEQKRHDKLMREMLNQGRGIQLRSLFKMTEYSPEVMVTFTQGYSITRFLVDRGGRGKFIAFLKDGLAGDWDKAVRAHYDFWDVRALEMDWMGSLRDPPPVAPQNVPRSQGSMLVTGSAIMADDGKTVIVTIQTPKFYYEPETTKTPDGKAVTSYRLNSGVSRQTIRLTEVKARTIMGQRLSKEQLSGALQKGIWVLLETDGNPIAPIYQHLLKPEAIVFTLEAPPLEAAPK